MWSLHLTEPSTVQVFPDLQLIHCRVLPGEERGSWEKECDGEKAGASE